MDVKKENLINPERDLAGIFEFLSSEASNCNGCANIGKKVATILRIDLSGIGRGDLSGPVRLKLWSYESRHL